MEQIKQTSTRWGGFIGTAIVYMLIDAVTDLAAWLATIGEDGFNNVTTYGLLIITTKIVGAMLLSVRKLMNGSFQDAKDQPPTNGKINLE